MKSNLIFLVSNLKLMGSQGVQNFCLHLRHMCLINTEIQLNEIKNIKKFFSFFDSIFEL